MNKGIKRNRVVSQDSIMSYGVPCSCGERAELRECSRHKKTGHKMVMVSCIECHAQKVSKRQ